MKTTSNRILISVKSHGETKNDLGLTLPDPLELQGIEEAEVLYVGDEIKCTKKGDKIYIYTGSGTKFKNPEDQKEYRVISVTDIIVIYE